MDPSGAQAVVASSVEWVRPRWRGRLHLAAFAVSLPAGVALCAVAGSSSALTSVAVYALTVCGVFGVSAAFHLVPWSPAGRRRMDRLDRAMIYLQIAGTYTPVSLLALGRGLAIGVLAVVWAGAAAGAALVLWRGNIRVVGLAIYMLLGWPSVVVLPFAATRVHLLGVALLLVGGVIYTAGAIMLVRRWPDLNPTIFGYHEVWHVLTLIAGTCHWTAIGLLVRST
ncbi:MAG TPA: hemolysin III family protein [Actinomycetota bacterium]|nr:hemolysin III family protein [Actinomycetota bacterium]